MIEDELTPEQKFAAEDPETMIPRALMEGRREEEIVQDVMRLGWSENAAKRLVEQAKHDLSRYQGSSESREELLKEAKSLVIRGIRMTLLGVALTAVSTILVLAGGSPVFFVTYGLIFVGLATAWRGRMRLRMYGQSRFLDKRAEFDR